MKNDFEQPQFIKTSSDYLYKLQENYQIYEKAIKLIDDEINSQESNENKIKTIEKYIDELQQEIYYL